MNIARLTILANFLDTVPPENFNMSLYILGSEAGLRAHACGTAACAGGYACIIPEFNDAGLHFNGYWPAYDGSSGFDALEQFFELTSDKASALFYSRYDTPKEKAQQIRDMIKEVQS